MTSKFNIGNISGTGHIFGNEGPVSQTITGGEAGGAAGPEQGEGSSAPPAPGHSGDDPGQSTEDTLELSDDEVAEFARVYSSRDRATMLLRSAGFRVEALPLFEASPSPHAFWSEVSEQIGHGLAVRGRQQLLAAARRDYPANPVFSGRHQGQGDAG